MIGELYPGEFENFPREDGIVKDKPQGEWIVLSKEPHNERYECPFCRNLIHSEPEEDMKKYHAFCGKCGARLGKEQK